MTERANLLSAIAGMAMSSCPSRYPLFVNFRGCRRNVISKV